VREIPRRAGEGRDAPNDLLAVSVALLASGLWLLYLQFFVWPATKGLVMMMTGFLIPTGSGWLFGDFLLPLIRRKS
jgi:hypothetical protein